MIIYQTSRPTLVDTTTKVDDTVEETKYNVAVPSVAGGI